MGQWTAEQEAAISTRGCNLLVSAAAGAGKTAVLVERIIRRILDRTDPVDVDRLLVVTFTNAAAQEMKERIGAVLTERARRNPGDRTVQKQLLLLGRSAISTLHSFCLEIIRQNYYRLSLPQGLALDPRFRIADDIEALLLKLEALEELFEDRYTQEDPLFLQLVECFGGERDDRVLQELVLKLYDFSRSQPRPRLWLKEIAHTFSASWEEDKIQDLFSNMVDSITLPLEEAAERLREAALYAARPGGPAVYLHNLQEETACLEEVLALARTAGRGVSWPALFAALGEIKFTGLKPCRDRNVDEKLKRGAQDLRNEAKAAVQRLQKQFLSRSPQEFVEELREMAPLMNALCQIVEDFSEKYLKVKFARNIIDFPDIEHFALNLLHVEEDGEWRPSPLAEKLRERFAEVLVDEYQDINNVQETILSLVARSESGSSNMFMVGDVKQSIYGFRLAEPGLFLAKYNQYSKNTEGLGIGGQKVVLARNFRSHKFIVDGVNYIFRQVMTEKLGGLLYDSDAQLVYGAGYPGAGQEDEEHRPKAIEVHLVNSNEAVDVSLATVKGEDNIVENGGDPDEGGNLPEEREDLDNLQLEARVIGRRIHELMGGKVWDKEKKVFRPVQYRDIVVLLRSTKGPAPVFLEEFRQMGIPAYADTGTGYFAAQEVQTMLSLLKIIDNPHQDIPLVAVLRSPVVGLTADELTAIRLRRPRGDFYDAVRLAARQAKEGVGLKIQDFLRRLRYWRTFARRNSLVELVRLLFRETGYYDYAGAMPGGKQRQANLRALHDRARQYENTTMKGLFKFLRFLEKLEETNNDLGAARALGEKEDVVRIMSIHKSKGLEFPIVFLAGLGRSFNQQDLRGDILIHKELGLGPVWVDHEKRLKYPTLAKMAVANRLKREMLAEEIRLLYVAMTRARESLLLVGALQNMEKKLAKWGGLVKHEGRELPQRVLSRAACFWDWLGPCLVRHEDGAPLRDMAGCAETGGALSAEDGGLLNGLAGDPSAWRFTIWNRESIQVSLEAERSDYAGILERVRVLQPVEEPDGTGELARLAGNMLGWQYAFRALADIPAKLSVSEIKHHYRYLAQDQLVSQTFSHWRQFNKRPLFLQKDQGLSAAERGSAFHLVMRHLELSAPLDEETIARQIKDLTHKEIITAAQGESVSPQVIAAFFRSSLGQRIINSPEVLREVPFTLALPAGELYRDQEIPPGERILVQGTIDCLFAEGDGFVLVDYKTDLVSKETLDLFKDRYRVQLELYSRAVEAALGRAVGEKILYSVCLHEAVTLE